MPKAKCHCGSVHDSVHGYKEHYQTVHDSNPTGQDIDRAILRAAGE